MSLQASLAEMPQSVRTYLREGLGALSRLTDAERRVVSRSTLEAFSSRRTPEEIGIPPDLKIAIDSWRVILTGETFLASSLSAMSGTPSELIDAIHEAKLVDEAQIPSLMQFAQLFDGELRRDRKTH